MSRRPSAPYDDEISTDGKRLLYEGHDAQRSPSVDPKAVDQPWTTGGGGPSDKARFARASEETQSPPLIRVYEKLRDGIWSDRGVFHLLGYKYESKTSENRKVFRFELELTGFDEPSEPAPVPIEHLRIIPSSVKQEVFKRDRGKCVICGAADQLHFDHDLPFSKGGTSLTAQNVRILCARHNLSKGARIE